MKIDEIKISSDENALYSLLRMRILTNKVSEDIFKCFLNDSIEYIEKYIDTCKEGKNNMYICSLETWQACITNIGLFYYRHYDLLEDYEHNRACGGVKYRDELLTIALEVYEELCYEYKKQFFIYDCCRYMGINKDLMYKLNNIHADLLKKAHTAQEASMRTALASGRSNVTAMAILLNHDYDYTRTTQIIHSTERIKEAEELPKLSESQLLYEIPHKNKNENLENI